MDLLRWSLDRVDFLAICGIIFFLCRRADRVTAAWQQILTSYQSVVDSLTTTSQRSLEIDAAVKQGQATLVTELCKVVSRDYLQAGLQFATINNPNQPVILPKVEAPVHSGESEVHVLGPEDISGFPQAFPAPRPSPDPRTHVPASEI